MKAYFTSPHFHIGGSKDCGQRDGDLHRGCCWNPTRTVGHLRPFRPLWPKEIEKEIIAANSQEFRSGCTVSRTGLCGWPWTPSKSRKVNRKMDFTIPSSILRTFILMISKVCRNRRAALDAALPPDFVPERKIYRIRGEAVPARMAGRSVRESAGMLALGTDFPVVDIYPSPVFTRLSRERMSRASPPDTTPGRR